MPTAAASASMGRKRPASYSTAPKNKKLKTKSRVDRGETRPAPCPTCVRRLARDPDAELCADQLSSGTRCAQCADSSHSCPGPIDDNIMPYYYELVATAAAYNNVTTSTAIEEADAVSAFHLLASCSCAALLLIGYSSRPPTASPPVMQGVSCGLTGPVPLLFPRVLRPRPMFPRPLLNHRSPQGLRPRPRLPLTPLLPPCRLRCSAPLTRNASSQRSRPCLAQWSLILLSRSALLRSRLTSETARKISRVNHGSHTVPIAWILLVCAPAF
nr:uncharacterized protein CTRU02_14382 [Colletotrichum truncatum]XP_036577016.1 uncharacterized protein CTRU02_13120 [Colletotrichum truncatum]KAF6782195.1 hypothetical protein CTRU02_14382 [Colletotrichum truncatum]KAF6783870.1 hypothetical protein CTRU02_13120 [Colletotrichum truncatum]